MRKVLGAGLFAAAGAIGGIGLHAHVIKNDEGGNVVAYVNKYDAYSKGGMPIIIEGYCDSSCTMGLGYKNVCFAPGSVLEFHPAYVPILFGLLHYVLDPAATKLMLEHYPPDALEVLRAHGVDLNEDPGGWRYPKLTAIPIAAFPAHYLCAKKAGGEQGGIRL
jgi:hypothetical protein